MDFKYNLAGTNIYSRIEDILAIKNKLIRDGRKGHRSSNSVYLNTSISLKL
jgi:hypothetical protein